MKNIILFMLGFLLIIPICSAPLLVWHFDEVSSKVDLSYKVPEGYWEKQNTDRTNSITGNAVGFDLDKTTSIIGPLFIIPIIALIFLFFSQFEGKIEDKDSDELDKESDEKIVERFIVDSLINGAEEDDIRRELDTRGFDDEIINKVFDDLESE